MAIEVGQPAPEFTLKDQDGNDVSLADFRGEKAVALVFYPFTFTGVCEGELCQLRDDISTYETAGVQVQFLGNVWGMDENAMKAAGTAANGVVFPVRTTAVWGGEAPGMETLRQISRVSDQAGNAYRPVHYLAGVCAAMNLKQVLPGISGPIMQQPEIYLNGVGDAFDEKGELVKESLAQVLKQYIAAFAAHVEQHKK